MTDTADQEKGRQEEQTAGRLASADASNKSVPTDTDQQPANATSKQSTESMAQGESVAANRDLGTVGGGNIPGSTWSESTNTSGSGSPGGNGGAEAPAHPESVKSSSTSTSSAATNTIDKQAKGNGGGRHPSQPQTPMGDQDATQGRSGDEVTEPMSSRAPDKINQKQK